MILFGWKKKKEGYSRGFLLVFTTLLLFMILVKEKEEELKY
jgi:hypothetical protein